MAEKNKTQVFAHIPLVTGLFAALLLSLAVIGIKATSVIGEDYPPCPTSQAIIINPPQGHVLAGVFPLEVSYFGPITELQKIVLRLDRDGLGEAKKVAGTTNIWRLDWDTTTVNNGPYEISSTVELISQPDCVLGPVFVTVDNPPGSNSVLDVDIIPGDWSGPTNVNFNFEAKAFLNGTGSNSDVTANTDFSWSTTVGSVVNSGGGWGNFFSGPLADSGKVTVTGSYGTKTDYDEADVVIFSDSTNLPYPDIDDDDSLDGGSSDSNKSILPPNPESSSGQGDNSLALCIYQRIGADQYQDLISSRGRLTPSQFEQVRTCFAAGQFVVPANLAPVNPDDVRNLNKNRAAKILKLENVKTDTNTDALQLSGEAEPDDSVLIYVFSEPLVLTTQADSDGRWTYTLEDPLAPGDHEAYVLVEKDDEYQRSDGFAFAIAQADASADNPNGYGLTLVGNDDVGSNQSVYLAGVAALVLLASVFLTRFVWFRKKEPPQGLRGPQDPPLGLSSPEPPKNEVDKE